MSALLECRPDELRHVARQLRSAGMQVSALGGNVSGPASSGWNGLAAIQQTSIRSATGTLFQRLADPGDQAAGVLDRVSAQAEELAAQVRRHTAQLDGLSTELARLRSSGPPPEPELLQAWERKVAETEGEVARHQELIRQLEAAFDRLQRWAASVLNGIEDELGGLRDEAVLLGNAAKRAGKVIAKGFHGLGGIGLLATGAQARWARTSQARQTAKHRAARKLVKEFNLASAKASKVPRWIRAPFGIVGGPVMSVLQWVGAAQDLWDGGGYDGWRGNVTRVLAGGALVSIPATYAAPLTGPAALVVAGTSITVTSAYQVWMAGNYLYDRRKVIAAAVRNVGISAGKKVLPLAVNVYGNGKAATRLAERAKERATTGIRNWAQNRVFTSKPVRWLMRQTGSPIRLPAVELVRLPVTIGLPGLGAGQGPGGSGGLSGELSRKRSREPFTGRLGVVKP